MFRYKLIYKYGWNISILFSVIFFQCNSGVKEENYYNVKESSFKVVKNVKFSNSNLQLSSAVKKSILIDTFLIVSDLSGNKNLKVINLKSEKVVGSLIHRGKKKYQAINISDLIHANSDSTFWAFDVTLQKFQKLNIYKALQNSRYIPESEFTLKSPASAISSPVLKNEDLIIGTSFAVDNCRYLVLNSQSAIFERVGKMPTKNSDWPEQNPKAKLSISGMTYSAVLKKHPQKNKAVVLYNYTDRIELYDQNKLAKIVKGPDNFNIMMDFYEQGDNLYVPIHSKETKYAFLDSFVSEKFIYALYSGTTRPFASKLFIYDWEGNPLKIFNLSAEITYFTIRESLQDTVLYGFEHGRLVHGTL